MVSRVLVAMAGLCAALAQTPPPTPPNPLENALKLFNSGQYQNTYNILSAYIQQHPESGGAYKMLGLTQFMLGKPNEALASMQRATQLAPQDADAYYYLGRIYFSRDNATQALAAFQKSLELNPSSVRTINNLGQTHEALGHPAEAEKAYRSAIALESQRLKRSEWPYYNLGLLYMNNGKVDEAIPFFRQALACNPGFVDGKIKLGVALSKKGPSPEALALFEQAAKMDPNNPEPHYRLGQALAKAGRQEEAAKELELFRKLKKR